MQSLKTRREDASVCLACDARRFAIGNDLFDRSVFDGNRIEQFEFYAQDQGVTQDQRCQEPFCVQTLLDGQVDVLGDAFTAIANLGTTSDAVWAQGDFNGDGIVEVLADAFLLISQLGQSVLP